MLGIFSPKKSNKILDSSVLIDGRIHDVLRSGFLEGHIVIPLFVVEEIQKLADSQDYHKRQKGKRGLETANKIKGLSGAEVWNGRIKEVDDSKEVDTKLVILSKHLSGKLLTLDSNLIEIAKMYEVPTLNIHELYLAVRPKFMFGDEFFVKIKGKGKEPGQGRGDYEGTMVVVDGGGDFIGQSVRVVVRQIYAQDTGVLLFTKLIAKEDAELQSP